MYIRVRVTPGAKKELVEKEKENEWRIFVKEKAEHNAANKRVRELIANHTHVPVSAVRLINGHRSRIKLFSVDNK